MAETRSTAPKPTRQNRLGGISDAFADANFRSYSVGAIVSWLSFFVQAVAVSWVAWNLTHSTGWLAAVALLDKLPMSLLAPLGGIVADRHDRFRVLLVCYAFATVQSAMLAILAATGTLTIGWLAVLALAHGIIHGFSVPSQFGLLPRFVSRERLPSAVAVAGAYTQLGLFVGPALAAWVLLRFGPATAFASNVFGYGVYFIAASRLRTPPDYVPPVRQHRPAWTDMREGLAAIAAHRGIMGLFTLMLFGDGLMSATARMLPAFSDRDLHAGVTGLSTMLAAMGVGATISALWLAQGGLKRSTVSAITWGFLGFLAATGSTMAAPSLLWAAAAMVAGGFCFEICRTGTVALLQSSVPDHLRGRVMSTQFLLQQGASALGVAAIGGVAEAWGIRWPILCGVGLAMLVWVITFRARDRMTAAFAPAR